MAALTKEIQLLLAIVLVLSLQQSYECKNNVNFKDQPVLLIKLSRGSFRTQSEKLSTVPVIVWHGMGDTARNQEFVSELIEDIYPGTPVYAVKVGDTDELDSDASVWGDPNSQIDRACKAILKEKDMMERKKVNFIGFSQGALLIRGLIERCPLEKHSIQVNNFISIGGPQQGVFGLPEGATNGKLSSYLLNKGVSMFAYLNYFQKNCLPATYWHNPKNEATYRKTTFLADINNEGNEYNYDYKYRFRSINQLVLVRFTNDTQVRPSESSFFGFYKKGSSTQIATMSETDLYQKDLFGLRSLDQEKRIHFIEVDSEHLEFSESWLSNEIIAPYLGQSLD